MIITLYDEYDDYYLCRLFFDKITDDITTLSLMTTVRKVLKKTWNSVFAWKLILKESGLKKKISLKAKSTYLETFWIGSFEADWNQFRLGLGLLKLVQKKDKQIQGNKQIQGGTRSRTNSISGSLASIGRAAVHRGSIIDIARQPFYQRFHHRHHRLYHPHFSRHHQHD